MYKRQVCATQSAEDIAATDDDTYLDAQLMDFLDLCCIFGKALFCLLYTSENELHYLDGLINLYTTIGYPCFKVSAKTGEGIEQIQEELKGRVTLFSGHSGVGKSTLINAILDVYKRQIQEQEHRLNDTAEILYKINKLYHNSAYVYNRWPTHLPNAELQRCFFPPESNKTSQSDLPQPLPTGETDSPHSHSAPQIRQQTPFEATPRLIVLDVYKRQVNIQSDLLLRHQTSRAKSNDSLCISQLLLKLLL